MTFRLIFGTLCLGLVCLGAGCSSSVPSSGTDAKVAPPPSSETISRMTLEEREVAIQSYLAQNPPKSLTQEELEQEALRMRQIVEGGQVKRIARIFEGTHNSQGEFRLVENEGKLYLAFSEFFSMDPGPFLTIEISDQLEPQSTEALQKGVHFVVAPLRSPVGGQVYELPVFDLTRMTSVVIHSPPFQTIYTVANFEQPL